MRRKNENKGKGDQSSGGEKEEGGYRKIKAQKGRREMKRRK